MLDTCRLTCWHAAAPAAGTGWVLREVGKGDEAALVAFCSQHIAHFSAEGLRYATEKLPAAARQQLVALRKEAAGKGSGGGSSS